MPDKIRMAPRTVDGNISLAPGHPKLFSAVRAPEIFVLSVTERPEQAPEKSQKPAPESQKSLIFCPALCMISGKHPVISPDQQQNRYRGENKPRHEKGYDNRRQRREHGKTAQLIHAVPPIHKVL